MSLTKKVAMVQFNKAGLSFQKKLFLSHKTVSDEIYAISSELRHLMGIMLDDKQFMGTNLDYFQKIRKCEDRLYKCLDKKIN